MSHANIDIGAFLLQFEKKELKYSVNEDIKGKLILKLRNDILSRGVYLKIMGKSCVIWFENEYDGDIEHNEPFCSNHIIINERIDLVKPDDNDDRVTLKKGDHEFDFCFKLSDFSRDKFDINDPYIYPFTTEHEFGEVKYYISGVLARSTNDFDYQTIQFIKIENTIETGATKPDYTIPYKCRLTKDYSSSILPSGSGMVSLEVTFDKLSYMPDEVIKCSIKMENENSMRKFTKLSIKLVQILKFFAHEPSKQVKMIEQEICSFKQVNFDNTSEYKIEGLMIQVPHDIRPPSSMSDKHLIHCNYELRVLLYTSNKLMPTSTKEPIEAKIPIIIYDKKIPISHKNDTNLPQSTQ